MFDISWQVLAGALVLDAVFGDPRWLPHPVVWMGYAISGLEKPFRQWIPKPLWAGLMFALFLIAGTWGLSALVIFLAQIVHPLGKIIVQTVLLFYCFSARSLCMAAKDVAHPLVRKDLARARVQVGYIVGRETKTLDGPAIARAAVETVAENFVDGFLSPLFFALVFGVPGAMAYKMVNTLDSMVGYTTSTYILFGRASARIDDLANFFPARLSMAVISLAAALISPALGKQALSTALSQGRRHKSPNAGYPEAAFAGALGVRMGGPNVYHGILVEKPYIGEAFVDPGPDKIYRACELMALSALVAAIGAMGVLWMVHP